MAPSRNAERDAREARDRLRRYNARQAVFGHQVKRRKRDNIIAIAGVVVVAALATATQVFYFTAGPGYSPSASPSASAAASASASPSASPAGQNTGDVPAKTIAEGRDWTGELQLNAVTLGFTLDGKAAPQGTSAFISLAKKDFYTTTGKTCHRLTTDGLYVIQCGSVNGDGTGDPGFSFGPVENAPTDGTYPAGTIALARGASEYSNSSQFFITYKDSTLPAPGYTVIGKVTSGLPDFISTIADAGVANGSTDGAPKVTTTITKLTLN